jgi:hypothetical protein
MGNTAVDVANSRSPTVKVGRPGIGSIASSKATDARKSSGYRGERPPRQPVSGTVGHLEPHIIGSLGGRRREAISGLMAADIALIFPPGGMPYPES